MIAADSGATNCSMRLAPDTHRTVLPVGHLLILFKAAMFAPTPIGSALCAIGYCSANVDASKIDLTFASAAGSVAVCANGAGIDFSEDEAKRVLSENEIKVLINLNSGKSAATAWGCDLTYDYVKINGDYRT